MNTDFILQLLKPTLQDLKEMKTFLKALESYNSKYINRVAKIIKKSSKSNFLTSFMDIPETIVDMISNFNSSITEQLHFSRNAIKKVTSMDKSYKAIVKNCNSGIKSIQNSFNSCKKDLEGMSSVSGRSRMNSRSCFKKMKSKYEYNAKRLEKQEIASAKKMKDTCKDVQKSINELYADNGEYCKATCEAWIDDLKEIIKRFGLKDEKSKLVLNEFLVAEKSCSKVSYLPSSIQRFTNNSNLFSDKEVFNMKLANKKSNNSKLKSKLRRENSIDKREFLRNVSTSNNKNDFSKNPSIYLPESHIQIIQNKPIENLQNYKQHHIKSNTLQSFVNPTSSKFFGISEFPSDKSGFTYEIDSAIDSMEMSMKLNNLANRKFI